MSKAIVDTRQFPRDSRFKSWTKTLTGVDISKTNGYCFDGEFVSKSGLVELALGSFLLHYAETGSRANHTPDVYVYRVIEDGVQEVYKRMGLPLTWALAVRDDIAEILAEAKAAAGEVDRGALEAETEQLRARLAEIEALLAS